MSHDLSTLAEALSQRIRDDTELLGSVLKMMAEQPPKSDLADWCPIDEISKATDGKISEATARWMARNRDENGTADAFRKLGKKLFVNPVLLMTLQK